MHTPTHSDAVAPGPRPFRILVADDEPNVVRLLVRIFEGRGHDVVAACSAFEALEALEAGSFDVVLVDLNMPGGGLAVVSRLEADPAFTGRIVLMTGALAADPTMEMGPSVSRLQKPFQMTEVIALVEGARPH